MAAKTQVDENVRLIGGGHPLVLVIDGQVPDCGDRRAVARFIESACIHNDASTCDDPLIRALSAFVDGFDA